MSTAIKVASADKHEGILPGERILAAASDLFYRHGIRAVGVEAIATSHPRMSWLQNTFGAWRIRLSRTGTGVKPITREIHSRRFGLGSMTWRTAWPAMTSAGAHWQMPPSSSPKRTTRRGG